MSITRRLFLRNTAVAGVASAVSAPADAAEPVLPLSPDERIDAAVEEIKAAFREKWPDAPIRIVDTDNGGNGMLMVITHVRNDKAGATYHERNGLARMTGGSRNG